MVIATYWVTVFHLASREAGTITPDGQRHPAQAGHRQLASDDDHHDPRLDLVDRAPATTSAAATSSLSAIGSSRVPSVVTWLRRRAMTPVEPVGERGGHEDGRGDEHVDARRGDEEHDEERDQRRSA